MKKKNFVRFSIGVVVSKGEIDNNLVETLQEKALNESNNGGYITARYRKGEYNIAKVTQLYNIEKLNFFEFLILIVKKYCQLLIMRIFGETCFIDIYIDNKGDKNAQI